MKSVSDKICRENQNTRFVFSGVFSIILPFMTKCGKYCTARQATRQCGACALHAGYLSLHTHTLRLCNIYRFSSATTVVRTRLSVTLYIHCLSCMIYGRPILHPSDYNYSLVTAIKMNTENFYPTVMLLLHIPPKITSKFSYFFCSHYDA